MYGDDSFLAFSVADSDEDNLISSPPPKKSYHRRHGHQTHEVDVMEDADTIMPEDHASPKESWIDKLERAGRVVGAILPPVTVLGLVIYIICAGMCYANNFYLLCF